MELNYKSDDISFLGGAFLSLNDINDDIYESLTGYEDAQLPSVHINKLLNPARDQGKTLKCAAITGCQILEFHSQLTLSIDAIYDQRNNRPYHGMYGKDLMRILVTYGSISKDGLIIKAKSYSKVTTLQGLKRALLEGPQYIVLPILSKNNDFWKLETQTTSQKITNSIFCHAVTCYGYDDQQAKLYFMNSWGTKYGNEGHHEIKYEDFEYIKEMWAVHF